MTGERLEIRLVPAGDATPDEVARINETLYERLVHSSQVEHIEREQKEPEEGGKGFDFGAFLLSLAPGVVEQVLAMIHHVIAPPQPAPTKLVIAVEGKSLTMEYDPRVESPTRLAEIARELKASLERS